MADERFRLGSCKPTNLTVSQVIALEYLIDRDVVKRRVVVYNRFVVNHVLYTSENYTRAKRHNDVVVKIDHLSANYGRELLNSCNLLGTTPD